MFNSVRLGHVTGLAIAMLLACPAIFAEDIDIFVGGTGAQTAKPNILFVLDNSANWSRNDQHWLPKGTKQGQAEVRAIKKALGGLTGKVNVGLMMYATLGSANDNAYVRHAIKELNSTNQGVLNSKLIHIDDNILTKEERRQSGPKYGYMMHDVYNYLAGERALDNGVGTPTGLDFADPSGYQAAYSQFRSPLTTADLCTDTYLVFIGNPESSGPSTDDSSNSNALSALVTAAGGTADRLAGSGSGTPLPIPKFTLNSQTEVENLGFSVDCYKDQRTCTSDVNAAESACRSAGYSSCACLATVKTPHDCSNKNDDRYEVQGTIINETMVPTGDYDMSKGRDWNLDDWSKFLYVQGVPIPGAVESDPRARVITYTIDVFNKKQNDNHTGLLMSAAKVGGGGYFFARNQETLEAVLETIISEIISVNSTFASASLPISATNRAQNENQVFIGMFRPEPYAKPRWYGNVKRYQLARFDTGIDLADVDKKRAVNLLSGFVAECASSFWTSDSVDYWADLGVVPDPRGQCGTAGGPYSDRPDGPFVEKGAAGQMLRGSNIANREVLTRSGAALVAFNVSNSGLASDLVDYTRGMDVDLMDKSNTQTDPRPTIHGDIVHSRPLPINYGGNAGVVVYYGTNDGMLRAVDAENGSERWSFIAREHFSKLARLRANEPLVAYPNQDQAANPLPKDYFFDGSIGQVVEYDDADLIDRAWIFPTMRRGGRMVYAFDVTTPDSPALMWRAGCPNVGDDVDCMGGLAGLGQTWSIPNAGFVQGYAAGAEPVLVMGGGYDGCEDADVTTPSCGSSKGRAVYILDAETGGVLASFPTDRPVPADVSLVDLDYDGFMDVAYAADAGGNLYRINFIDPITGGALAPDAWQILKVARTQGSARKFLYGPAVMAYRDMVYLALGSGNRERPLETNYPYTSNVQDRFYVFLDKPREDPADVATGTYPYNLDDATLMHNRTVNPGCDAAGVVPGTVQRGWFMDLPNRGEQTVTNAIIVAGMATFSTSRPGGTAVGICARPIGIAAGYWVNLFNGSGAIGVTETCGGSRSRELAGGGLPPAPVLATVPIDGKPTMVVIGAPPRDGSTGTPISPQEIKPAITHKRTRLFWSSDVDR